MYVWIPYVNKAQPSGTRPEWAPEFQSNQQWPWLTASEIVDRPRGPSALIEVEDGGSAGM